MGICESPKENQSSDGKGILSVDGIKDYLSKAEKAICQIKKSDGGIGSGFFCKIPYTENDNLLLPVLITCNQVLDRKSITSNDITIIINGETKTIPLKGRHRWTDIILQFTCIEIKENEDNINTFFYLDYNILGNNSSNNCYLGKKILIFGINKNDKQIAVSNGLIKECKPEYFEYTCNTYPGYLGGCIVNQNNNCVIGVDKGKIDNSDLSTGIFIRDIIIYLKENKSILEYVSK